MLKNVVIGLLGVILLGAVVVGVYDATRGASTVKADLAQFGWANSGPTNQGDGSGLGYGQGQGQRYGQGQGQGQGNGPGNGNGVPQDHEWISLTGPVVAADGQQLTVDAAERGQLSLRLGKPGFAATQGVIFTPGDTVTILGFDGQNGQFQAGQITNDTTGAVLHLRDPNGRPLWAGQGQGGQGQGRGNGQGGGQGQGQGRGQGNGQGQGWSQNQ